MPLAALSDTAVPSSPPHTASHAPPAALSNATTPLPTARLLTILRPRALSSSKSTPSLSPSARRPSTASSATPTYASRKQTALDVTVTCPACPTYLTPAAAACSTRCTDQAEVARHTKYRQIAVDAGVHFSVAAFTSVLSPTAAGGPSSATSTLSPTTRLSSIPPRPTVVMDGMSSTARQALICPPCCRCYLSRKFSHALQCRSHAPRWEPRRRTWPLLSPGGE
jgi:hypothetical protein